MTIMGIPSRIHPPVVVPFSKCSEVVQPSLWRRWTWNSSCPVFIEIYAEAIRHLIPGVAGAFPGRPPPVEEGAKF